VNISSVKLDFSIVHRYHRAKKVDKGSGSCRNFLGPLVGITYQVVRNHAQLTQIAERPHPLGKRVEERHEDEKGYSAEVLTCEWWIWTKRR
jgi:hypothetical protein